MSASTHSSVTRRDVVLLEYTRGCGAPGPDHEIVHVVREWWDVTPGEPPRLLRRDGWVDGKHQVEAPPFAHPRTEAAP